MFLLRETTPVGLWTAICTADVIKYEGKEGCTLTDLKDSHAATYKACMLEILKNCRLDANR